MTGDLPPLARISAAIEKLERLKAESTPGPWGVESMKFGSEMGDYVGAWIPGVAEIAVTEHEGDTPPLDPDDADIIVTLHRTIDAQLDVLNAIEWWVRHNKVGEENAAVCNVLKLADAILGGES